MKENKKKDNFYHFLMSLYKPVKFLTFVMIFSMMASQIFNLVKQYLIKGIIDLPTHANFQIADLYQVMVILIIVIILELICYYISNIVRNISILKRQSPYIAEKLFRHLNKKKYPFFIDHYSGKISSAIDEVNDQMIELNWGVTTKFISLLTLMISNLVILYTINFYIFLVAFILFAGIITTRIIYFSRKYLPLIKNSQIYAREYNGILNDAVLNFNSLKIYNSVDNFAKTLRSKKEDANYYKNKASKREFTYGALANVIYVVIFVILIFYSIHLFSRQAMSLGDLVFFINSMIALKSATTEFTWSYINLGEILIKLKNSYELLYSGNNLPRDKKKQLQVINGKIDFQHIFFKYNKTNIFEDLSLTIHDREKIGIIGVSGSGKTTLVNLLFKFYQPQQGEILIDEKNIHNYSTESLYDQLTYVPQETILLHSTIYENIKIANVEATDEEIMQAAKKAELHDFIESLEDGYQTIVGERGIKLSGGQRQRIALARIFLRNSKIVIFDEATSSLDNGTEFRIQQNINHYFKDQTIICIAHRLSTLKDMDRIVVLEHGKIIDEGIPSEIIPKYEHQEQFMSDQS